MKLPQNAFRRGLAEGRRMIGLWNALPGGFAAEVLAGAGFDWIVIDTEHAPMDPLLVLPQLQAMAPYDVAPVVRPAANDPVTIKRLLDAGAQTLLVPHVSSVADARAAVAAMRYPPEGIRGVAGITRASRFGRIADYTGRAASELCLVVQIETRAGLDALEEIAAVDGVDALFIGPSDLAASLGHPGRPDHAEVARIIEEAIARIRGAGKPAGILALDPDMARHYIAQGSSFTAVGIDVDLLARRTEALAAAFQVT